MADYLINKKYRDKQLTVGEETKKIQTLAANLIKAEIRDHQFQKNVYPDTDGIKSLNWSSPLLRHFLQSLINSELKRESLAQCIIKATKKR